MPRDPQLPETLSQKKCRSLSDLTQFGIEERLQLVGTQPPEGTPAAWFLGPKAENMDVLKRLIDKALDGHAGFRKQYHPNDPTHISQRVRSSQRYKDTVCHLERETAHLLDLLQRSAPFASMRYQGHMLWDQTLPSMVGYVGAMLYNQNNVAAEASPLTTLLEIAVGNDLCNMLGYEVRPDGGVPASGMVPWGHITSGGTVANIEALWAARNAKFYPIALKAAVESSAGALVKAKQLEVQTLDGCWKPLVKCDAWELLNMKLDSVVELPRRISQQFGLDLDTINVALEPHALAHVGMMEFYRRHLQEFPAPVAFVPATAHYSWPKAATVLGLGQRNLIRVAVDMNARMSVSDLRTLLEESRQKRRPVLAVIAVIGSTQESAVDPLDDILALREEFRRKGLDFAVHCDAAWGGYFCSMLPRARHEYQHDEAPPAQEIPTFPLSYHVRDQLRAMAKADSITVDPHKGGYAPYPAGALCYRNSAVRDLISLRAPVVFHSEAEPTVGIYGLEGSKPGAAAAGVWLAHRVVRPNASGYGRILGQCAWTSTRMYARLATFEDEKVNLVPFQMLPSEKAGRSCKEIEREREYIREHFVEGKRGERRRNRDLQKLIRNDATARETFANMGSDLVITAFAFNFWHPDGGLNQDIAKMNALNNEIFNLCSVTKPLACDELNKIKLILTGSSFDPDEYGQDLIDHYAHRLGVSPIPGASLSFLISTTMDPWTTETSDLKGNTVDFLEVVEEALRDAAHTALRKLGYWS